GYDATPLVMTMATTGFDETLWINPSAINPTGNESNGGTAPPPGVNPWSWTVGANTYVSTEFGRTPFSFNPSVWAWSGNPQLYWQGNTGTNGWTMLDL